MKIKSSFKDYYDFVANQYGGGDPDCVYPRHRLFPVIDGLDWGIDIDIEMKLPYISHFVDVDTKWMACAGKLYLLIDENSCGDWKIITKSIYDDYINRRKNHYLHRMFNVIHSDLTHYVGVESDDAIKLSRKLNAPVFTFKNKYNPNKCKYYINVDSAIPVLENLGMQKIISPQQMYQELSYFIGNTMHESPDLAPPVQVSDKDRIVQHGFDLKQSFRHRK